MATRQPISASGGSANFNGSASGAPAGLREKQPGRDSKRLSPLPGWSAGSNRAPLFIYGSPSATERTKASLQEWPVWLASILIHAFILFVFWLVTIGGPVAEFNIEALFGEFADLGDSVQLDTAGLALDQADLTDAEPERSSSDSAGAMLPPEELLEPLEAPLEFDPSALGEQSGFENEVPSDLGSAVKRTPDKRRKVVERKTRRPAGAGVAVGAGADLKGLLDGRSAETRARLAKAGGGSKESEDAVELGLKWLARHQQSDGSWSFQHGPDDPGTANCPQAATGLALMAFLGAGYTHKQGQYAPNVERGLRYLIDQMDSGGTEGWLCGIGIATMYTQGIGATALCEAYAMTKDRALRRPAQQAITFIVNAQDPQGGGWRYRIPQAGDTSVLGWQLMAIKSAISAELDVPSNVLVGATRFLESVESDDGAFAGYTNRRSSRPSTTAVALLCRMYLGRPQSHSGLKKGMDNISRWGPMPDEMYYTYYATQAMHHWGGGQWTHWNSALRDQLVKRQAKKGDAAGSWMTDSSHGAEMGGRLYTTCLSIMTLEVYYRYLPLYKRKALNTDPSEET